MRCVKQEMTWSGVKGDSESSIGNGIVRPRVEVGAIRMFLQSLRGGTEVATELQKSGQVKDIVWK